MFTFIIDIYQSKLAIVMSILALLWAVDDANERFNRDELTANKPNVNMDLSTLALPQLTLNQFNEITNQYKKYQPQKKADNKPKINKGLSIEEQAKQQGKLSSLQIGDIQLTLKAVIKSDTDGVGDQTINKGEGLIKQPKVLQALILVVNIITNENSIKKFSDMSQVFGYDMKIDSHRQITLSKKKKKETPQSIKEETEQEQQIILTLYK